MKDIYQCYECGIGLTSNPDRRCEHCGERDWFVTDERADTSTTVTDRSTGGGPQ
jgi:rRNA maturation endonuclease Nob1